MVCVALIVGAHKNNDKKTLTRDKKIAEIFRSIAKKGYGFAYSVHCGDNEPVINELNF